MAKAYPLVEFSDITFEEQIGRGAFGIVYKANWLGSVIAVKDFFPNDEKDGKKVEKELIQSFIIGRHPNIIDIFGVSVKYGNIYLLMEYAYGGSLKQFLFGSEKAEYTTERAISWMYQCAKGVAFLHSKKLLHRNLQPRQLLLTDKNYETLRICGFGSVRELKTTMTENIGSLPYIAPEVFDNNKYTEKCDVFSFAIILWEVFTREEYFRTFNSHWAIPIQVVQGDRPKLKDLIPDKIQTLMTSCWEEDPSERLSMKDVVVQMKGFLEAYSSNGFADRAKGNEVIPSNSTSQDYPSKIKTIPGPLKSSSNIELEEEIGRGAFGNVHKAKWRGIVIAVKDFFPNDEKDRKKIEKELTQSLRIANYPHPNIIDLYGHSVKNGHTYLLMEYAYGGSLQRVLFGSAKQKYTRERAISWMYQCAQGIAFLHSMKLLHRDLKPHNLLLTDKSYETLKICDFGTVSELKTTMTEFTGTAAWMAPEVFEGGKYTEKCDIFSFAIILWEVFAREEYYKRFPNIYSIIYDVRKGNNRELKDEWPEELKQLMTSCWDKDPSKRPCMEDVELKIKFLFKHQWFNGLAVASDRAEGNEIIPTSSTSQDYPFKIKIPPEIGMASLIGDIKEILMLEQLTSLNSIKKEILGHPLPATLLDLYFTFSEERTIYYGLEYVEGGSLYKMLHFESKPYADMNPLECLLDLALGLEYFHKKDICVNMLTSRNLFIDRSGKLKIGLPVEEEEANFLKTSDKSAAWMAPEVHEDGTYSKESDVYSLGIIIWEIINRQIPFEGFKPDEIAEKVKRGVRPPLKEDENESIKELLKSCWERDPGSRPIANSVYCILKKAQIDLVDKLHKLSME